MSYVLTILCGIMSGVCAGLILRYIDRRHEKNRLG